VEKGPIFVAGLERSGTSLLYALLASHPNIAMTRRTNLWTHFYGQYGDLADDANLDRCINVMMQYKRLVKLDPDERRLREAFRSGDPTYARLFALLEQQHADRVGRPRWGDKSLHTERYAEPILDGYPGARILHMMRDPRDRYASSLTRWRTRRGGAGAGTAEWLSSARIGARNGARFPAQYLVVRYETFAAQPEQAMRQICGFIDEPYAPEMLEMRGARDFRDQGSNSSYGARPAGVISTDSIGRFREVLSARQIAFIQRSADAEMAALGYAPVAVRLTGRERALFRLKDVPVEQVRSAAWRARDLVRNRKGRPVPAYRLVPRHASA
jgi:mRNA-degrading endonuclease toxin of MazEF toxin-antitoxin module